MNCIWQKKFNVLFPKDVIILWYDDLFIYKYLSKKNGNSLWSASLLEQHVSKI